MNYVEIVYKSGNEEFTKHYIASGSILFADNELSFVIFEDGLDKVIKVSDVVAYSIDPVIEINETFFFLKDFNNIDWRRSNQKELTTIILEGTCVSIYNKGYLMDKFISIPSGYTMLDCTLAE